MTVKQLKDCINEIPKKFDGKIIEVGGDLISEHVSNFNISWMDCSDGFLLFIEKILQGEIKMEKLFSDAYRKAYEYEHEDYKRDYGDNENLLKETIHVLKKNGKTISHIQFVACNQGIIDLGQFFSLADRMYDAGYGGPEVLEDLVVVGADWWLERHEYDGSEWWEYKEHPKMPDNVWENPHLFYEDKY